METWQDFTGSKGWVFPQVGERKIRIEYLYLICGNLSPFSFRYRSDADAFPDMYEAPFVIHWEGFKGSRKGCPMGNIELLIKKFEGEIYLIKNLDIDKLTAWIIQQLIACPISVRVQKYAVNEKAWVVQLSPDTTRLLQKN